MFIVTKFRHKRPKLFRMVVVKLSLCKMVVTKISMLCMVVAKYQYLLYAIAHQSYWHSTSARRHFGLQNPFSQKLSRSEWQLLWKGTCSPLREDFLFVKILSLNLFFYDFSIAFLFFILSFSLIWGPMGGKYSCILQLAGLLSTQLSPTCIRMVFYHKPHKLHHLRRL